MPKSTKTTKIQFARIRQTKTDYLKYFVAKKLKLATVAGLTFLLGILFTVNIVAVAAQPAANPPGGNVNAGFNNVELTGSITGITNMNLGGLVLSPVHVNDSLLVSGPALLNQSLSVSGVVNNPTASNGGRVLIDDAVDIRGTISNQTVGLNNPVRVDDSLEVTGAISINSAVPQIRSTTGNRIRILNGDNTPGEIGSYYTRTRTTANSGGNTWVSLSCRPNHKLTGCNAYISNENSPANAMANHLGTTPSNDGNSGCNSMVQTKTFTIANNAIRIVSSPPNNNVRYDHTVAVTCFDPSGFQVANETLN